MERETAVFLREIDKRDRTFSASWGRSIERLAASIKTIGQTSPVLVRRREDGALQVVHGFARTRALESLGLETARAVILDGDNAAPGRSLDLMFWDNLTTRGFNLVEAAMIARALQEIAGRSMDEIITTYLPALGFEPSEKIFDRLLAIPGLPGPGLDWLVEKNAALGTAALLGRVPEDVREAVLEIVESLNPGQNLVRELVPLLMEIRARESVSISELMASPMMAKALDPEQGDRNQRLAAAMAFLRRRRGPETEKLLSALSALQDSLSLPAGVFCRKSSQLDPLELVFEVRAESPESLGQRARSLLDLAGSEAVARFYRQWS